MTANWLISISLPLQPGQTQSIYSERSYVGWGRFQFGARSETGRNDVHESSCPASSTYLRLVHVYPMALSSAAGGTMTRRKPGESCATFVRAPALCGQAIARSASSARIARDKWC